MLIIIKAEDVRDGEPRWWYVAQADAEASLNYGGCAADMLHTTDRRAFKREYGWRPMFAIVDRPAPTTAPAPGPAYCSHHQHAKWCEHNGGVMGATGWEAPAPGLDLEAIERAEPITDEQLTAWRARCPTCDREGCEWWTLGTPSQPKNSMANVSKIDGRTLPSNCLAQNTFDDCGRHAVDWRARAIAAEDDAARWQRVAPLIEQLRAWSDAPPIVSAVVREIFVIIDDRAAPEGETP